MQDADWWHAHKEEETMSRGKHGAAESAIHKPSPSVLSLCRRLLLARTLDGLGLRRRVGQTLARDAGKGSQTMNTEGFFAQNVLYEEPPHCERISD